MTARRGWRRRPARALATGLVWLVLAGTAAGHEAPVEAIPLAPGLRLDAAVAAGAFDAGDASAWPARRIAGWLGQGQGADDRRGGKLEHASFGAGMRLDEHFGARFAAGRHASGRTHVETAVVAWSAVADADDSSQWLAEFGRRGVPLGAVIDLAGSFDAFALAPLAKRLVLNDDWIDDGVHLAWQREADADRPGLTHLDAGAWRARTYPGGQAGPPALTFGLGGSAGEFDWDLAFASLRPRERGTPIVATGTGHTHTLPDCRASIDGLVCYSGRSRIVAAGARWAPHDVPWSLQGALLGLEERGHLVSASGDVDYRGHHSGGWLEGRWQWSPDWATSVRAERVQTRHVLEGANANLLADEAGLRPNHPAERYALAAAWTWRPEWQATLEAGKERVAGTGSARWVGVRLIWKQELARWLW